MKKALTILFAVACTAVFAGANNLLIVFSTPGLDKYADGETVIDGECYALVWTSAKGAQETVITAPIAKDGKCPPVLFQLDEAEAAAYTDGTWGVYLLDTRDFAKDATGKTLAGVDAATGEAKKVNTKAAVADALAAVGGDTTVAMSSKAVAAAGYDVADVPSPKVEKIQVVGANVLVTVSGTVPYLNYTLTASGESLQDFAIPEGASASKGTAGDGTIVLTTPKKGGAQFFKVTRK